MFFIDSFFNVPLQPRLSGQTDVDSNLKGFAFVESNKEIRSPTVIVEFAVVFGVLTSIDILHTVHTGITPTMERLEAEEDHLGIDQSNPSTNLFLPLSLLQPNKHFSEQRGQILLVSGFIRNEPLFGL